ncbi:hypothetical protein PAXRUDRAFT_805994, partial [Paxillus rubicundulus Ve08.2h10]
GPATGNCKPTIKETLKGITCIINCPCKETFQYSTERKGSNMNPCWNVPVLCHLCIHTGQDTEMHPTIWHYDMEEHLSTKH